MSCFPRTRLASVTHFAQVARSWSSQPDPNHHAALRVVELEKMGNQPKRYSLILSSTQVLRELVRSQWPLHQKPAAVRNAPQQPSGALNSPVLKLEGPCAANASAERSKVASLICQRLASSFWDKHRASMWVSFRRCCQASMNVLFGNKAKRRSCQKSFIELHSKHEFRVGRRQEQCMLSDARL